MILFFLFFYFAKSLIGFCRGQEENVSGMNGLIVLEDSLERDRRWCEIVETRGKKMHYSLHGWIVEIDKHIL